MEPCTTLPASSACKASSNLWKGTMRRWLGLLLAGHRELCQVRSVGRAGAVVACNPRLPHDGMNPVRMASITRWQGSLGPEAPRGRHGGTGGHPAMLRSLLPLYSLCAVLVVAAQRKVARGAAILPCPGQVRGREEDESAPRSTARLACVRGAPFLPASRTAAWTRLPRHT